MRFPTIRVGDGTLVQKRVVSPTFCRLMGVMGFNNSVGVYIQIHETAAEPGGGATPVFHYQADPNRQHYWEPISPVDMAACTVVVSSTVDTYTAAGGTNVSIQAILAS